MRSGVCLQRMILKTFTMHSGVCLRRMDGSKNLRDAIKQQTRSGKDNTAVHTLCVRAHTSFAGQAAVGVRVGVARGAVARSHTAGTIVSANLVDAVFARGRVVPTARGDCGQANGSDDGACQASCESEAEAVSGKAEERRTVLNMKYAWRRQRRGRLLSTNRPDQEPSAPPTRLPPSTLVILLSANAPMHAYTWFTSEGGCIGVRVGEARVALACAHTALSIVSANLVGPTRRGRGARARAVCIRTTSEDNKR